MSALDDETQEIPPHQVGEIVAGRYRLDSLLGRGGMGYVYRATHLELEEPVVVKFIDPAFAHDPVARLRFRREAKALVRIRHPGIVTMREFGEADGRLFLVMELLVGRTLGDCFVASAHAFSLDFLYELFRQLCEVLAAIHAAGIIHRDLKPDNVMLVPDATATALGGERVVVMDFGVARIEAKRESGVSLTGNVLGTPAYMSPEQCAGKESGPEGDMYALGVLMFLALSGKLPFDAHVATLLMTHHLFVAPPKVVATATGTPIPPGFSQLIDELLAKSPENRPTAAQCLERLAAIRRKDDPYTFGAASSERRLVDMAKSRQERAIPIPTGTKIARDSRAATLPINAALLGDSHTLRAPTPETGSVPHGEAEKAAHVTAWLHGFARERLEFLVSSLAVHGIAITETPEDNPPDEAAIAILSGADATAVAEKVRTLRSKPETATLPLLVIDLPDAGSMPGLIRAGASDASLELVGDDTVAGKAWRLIRRKR